jgi:hypothetical protein
MNLAQKHYKNEEKVIRNRFQIFPKIRVFGKVRENTKEKYPLFSRSAI